MIYSQGKLLSYSKNAASRSKWLFGLFAGLIGIISNEIFNTLPLTKKWIILLALMGAVINAFAMTNFEKIQFEMEREIGSGEQKDMEKANVDASTELCSQFKKYKGLMALAIIVGFIAGVLLVVSLFWNNIKISCR